MPTKAADRRLNTYVLDQTFISERREPVSSRSGSVADRSTVPT